MMLDLLDRLPDIAALLIGRYAEELPPVLVADLRRRYAYHDWLPVDVLLLREQLPARLRWLLEGPGEVGAA